MNALEVKGLTKVYPEFTLDKISFCVPQGHIVGLIGRNGAGKSTTLKGILRLIAAEGAVYARRLPWPDGCEPHPWLYSLGANGVSFAAGWALADWLPGLF